MCESFLQADRQSNTLLDGLPSETSQFSFGIRVTA
jgi:hypothetical protein